MSTTRRLVVPALACALALAACSSAPGPERSASPPASTSPTASPSAISRPPATPTPAATPAAAPPAARTTSSIPPVSAQARRDGLRDVRTIVPDAVVDLRYATPRNFTGVRLYPTRARCLVHRSMAAGLTKAAAALRRSGLVLVFWDCYRPHAVQVRMYKVVSNPAWVAKPERYARSHEAGRSVDVTVARRSTAGSCTVVRTRGHCQLDMGTGFDNFTPRAYAYATRNVSARAEANRAKLRKAMGTGKLKVYSGEWWHFDGPGAAVNRPILKAPVY